MEDRDELIGRVEYLDQLLQPLRGEATHLRCHVAQRACDRDIKTLRCVLRQDRDGGLPHGGVVVGEVRLEIVDTG